MCNPKRNQKAAKNNRKFYSHTLPIDFIIRNLQEALKQLIFSFIIRFVFRLSKVVDAMAIQMSEPEQNFRNWLFSLDRWKKRLLLITFDGLAAPITLLLAFFMRLETIDYLYQPDTYIGVSIATLATLVVFTGCGMYNNLTRHTSIETAYSIAIGSVLSCAILLSGILLLELEIPASVPLIFATLLCALTITMRLFIRTLGQNLEKENPENVAIYGAGAAGIQLMEALRKNPNYLVRLFIDDDPELDGKRLGGVQIRNLVDAKKKFSKLKLKFLTQKPL